MSDHVKPHAPATERNRDAILAVLEDHLSSADRVLEIGSGSGQHAVYFAAALPRLTWQCSDRQCNLVGIGQWLNEAALSNTPPALCLDVNGPWPQQRFDAVFSANTLHIMAWAEVQRMFQQLPQVLTADAKLIIYGPFNYAGRYTSDSNAAFDRSLRAQDAHSGIRDFEQVEELAKAIGLHLIADLAMPANNRCLIWQAGAQLES